MGEGRVFGALSCSKAFGSAAGKTVTRAFRSGLSSAKASRYSCRGADLCQLVGENGSYVGGLTVLRRRS